jgi:hypothetical protein
MSVIETTATEAVTEQLAEALAPQPEAALPAVVEHHAPAVLNETEAVWQIAERVAATEMVPKDLRNRPEAVFAVMLYGREIGLAPMNALQSIHFIEGKPAQSADLMRATVRRRGHHIKVVEWTNQLCTLTGTRCDDDESLTVTFTMEDAKVARVDQKAVWKQHPRRMLLARATSELCVGLFSDCLSGVIYTPEELEDVGGGQQQQGQARPPAEPGTMSEANQQRFTAAARERGLDDEAIRQVVLAASDGATDRLGELPATGTQVRALRAALDAWQPADESAAGRSHSSVEVAQDGPAAPEERSAPAPVNQFATAGRQAKARKIADWLIANEVEADDSLVNASPEERRAIGESAGVANKAGTPPSDETWAQVIDLVRQHQPATGDAFQGVAP